jgi:nitroimidazol reductase NimA-like FMN-containing flavoprotein (pyridoxamine 5'-phosphate oxidase superfamily)
MSTQSEEATRVAAWMGPDRCRSLLSSTRVCRLAFVIEGRPQIVVLNHAVDGEAVVFQTSPGARLAGLTADGATVPVTIEVDSASGAMHSGWSIVASGQLSQTTAADIDHHPSPWRDDAIGILLRMTVEEIHGQVVGA